MKDGRFTRSMTPVRWLGLRPSDRPLLVLLPQAPLLQEVVDRCRRLHPGPHRRRGHVGLVGEVSKKQELPPRRRLLDTRFTIAATLKQTAEQERDTGPGRQRGEQDQQISVQRRFSGSASPRRKHGPSVQVPVFVPGRSSAKRALPTILRIQNDMCQHAHELPSAVCPSDAIPPAAMSGVRIPRRGFDLGQHGLAESLPAAVRTRSSRGGGRRDACSVRGNGGFLRILIRCPPPSGQINTVVRLDGTLTPEADSRFVHEGASLLV